jgi:NIPSNAP
MTKRFSVTGFGISGIALGILIGLVLGFVAGENIDVAQGAQVAPGTAQGAQPAQPTPGTQAGQGGRGQRGPATPPAPCGPNIAGDLGKNTAPDSRCFELRMYTVDPTRDGVGNFKGGINELHKRFREGEVEVFQKSGVQVLAVWQNLDEPNMLIYLLAYKDRAARDAGWAAFNADPKWTELRNKYFVPLNARAIMMSASDYSPLK